MFGHVVARSVTVLRCGDETSNKARPQSVCSIPATKQASGPETTMASFVSAILYVMGCWREATWSLDKEEGGGREGISHARPGVPTSQPRTGHGPDPTERFTMGLVSTTRWQMKRSRYPTLSNGGEGAR